MTAAAGRSPRAMEKHRCIPQPLAVAVSVLGVVALSGCSAVPSAFASPDPDVHFEARANPLNPEEPLHCTPIWGLSPAAAAAELQARGWRLTYRVVTTTGPDTGFAQPVSTPPTGVVTSLEYGDPGWLQMFVSPVGDREARPIAKPADCA